MFDLSWTELFFVAALALIVIGPKDLPAFFRGFNKIIISVRRMYQRVRGSMNQLEREIDTATGKDKLTLQMEDYLPDEIRNLPEDFTPGSMTAEQHIERQRKGYDAYLQAKADRQTKDSEDAADRPSNEPDKPKAPPIQGTPAGPITNEKGKVSDDGQ